jgi:hypothetical protein
MEHTYTKYIPSTISSQYYLENQCLIDVLTFNYLNLKSYFVRISPFNHKAHQSEEWFSFPPRHNLFRYENMTLRPSPLTFELLDGFS